LDNFTTLSFFKPSFNASSTSLDVAARKTIVCDALSQVLNAHWEGVLREDVLGVGAAEGQGGRAALAYMDDTPSMAGSGGVAGGVMKEGGGGVAGGVKKESGGGSLVGGKRKKGVGVTNHGVKKLAGASTKGMKPLSSFFSKK
jgi:hypothetical protein